MKQIQRISGKVYETKFIATFHKIDAPRAKRRQFKIELTHIEKPESALWDDAIACAWIRLKDLYPADEWELREVLAFTSDNNCLAQHSLRVNSNPRGTFDTWRDLTYQDRFNVEFPQPK